MMKIPVAAASFSFYSHRDAELVDNIPTYSSSSQSLSLSAVQKRWRSSAKLVFIVIAIAIISSSEA
jgi:hypothetical protein